MEFKFRFERHPCNTYTAFCTWSNAGSGKVLSAIYYGMLRYSVAVISLQIVALVPQRGELSFRYFYRLIIALLLWYLRTYVTDSYRVPSITFIYNPWESLRFYIYEMRGTIMY